MLLLSFKVQNHNSLRDEVTLSFQRPSLRTLTPRAGTTWEESVHTIAGIFGGNATGKSTVLDALWYMFAAIEQSSTSWQARRLLAVVWCSWLLLSVDRSAYQSVGRPPDATCRVPRQCLAR